MSLKFKKALSIFLAAVMMFSVFSVIGFATPAENVQTDIPASSNGEICPTIIIPGISQSNSVYCDKNGNPILDGDGNKLEGGLLIIDSTNLVSKIVKNLALPLISSLLMQRPYKTLASGVYKTICDLFYVQASDKTGSAVNNLVVDKYEYPLSRYDKESKEWFYNRLPMEPVIEEVSATYGVDGEAYTYLYTFPLIGDPMTAAENLFNYIDIVKTQTGCKKVNLVPISLGGTVMTAYCDLVVERGGDFSDINNIVNVVACLDGTDLFADFYARNWNLSDEFLYGSYIPAIMAESGSDEYVGHLINIALRILPKDVLYTILTAAMDGLLDTLLVNCPQFWSMVPSDRYDELAEKYLSGEDMAAVRAKTDRFQQARLNLKENLKYAHDAYGVDVFSVSGYGRQYDTGDYCFLGIAASSASSNSDSIIDIDSTSLGATYAPVGETLENGNSPDKSIDTSTCLFPETTWFFCGQHHEVGRADVIIKLLAGIVSENITDVNSSEAFPQFNYNRNTRALVRPYGLMDKAESVIENADGKYTQEQINTVKPVYEKAAAMLKETVLTPDSAKEADDMTVELNDALAVTGLTSKTKTTSFFVKILNKLTANLDNAVMKTFGGNGYTDKIFNK